MRPLLALDLDGTLITVAQKQTNLLRALARARGLNLDPGPIWLLKRDGASTKSALVGTGVPMDLAHALSRAWVAAVETPYWQSLDSLLPRVEQCLTHLKSQADCVIISARQNASFLHQQVRRLGLSDYVSAVYQVHPNCASVAKAEILSQIGAVGFIGDTESDAKAAKLANVPFVAVSTGQRSEAFLRAAGIVEVHADLYTAVNFLLYQRYS